MNIEILGTIKDPDDDNVDVLLQFDDGRVYSFLFATPKNIYWCMQNDGLGHYFGVPPVLVRTLTLESIENALKAIVVEDGGKWLAVYGTLSSKSPQPLIHIDDANVYLSKIGDVLKRSLVADILAEIGQFYNANTSSLETPFDLAFVCKVLDYGLKDTLDLLRGIVDEALYWNDELPKLMIAPIDPQKDSTEHARRIIQAENYCARHSDKWMAAVLAGVLSVAGIMIRATGPKFRYNPGRNRPQIPAALPAEPLDYLFLVQALDYALRLDGPVRTIIQAHESSLARRSEG